LRNGLVHIYTGEGKGKTTCAFGLGFRAVGCGLKVIIVQFLKCRPTGEVESASKFSDEFKVYRFATIGKFYNSMEESEKIETENEMKKAFDFAKEMQYNCDMLILDEIFAAVSLGIIKKDELCEFIKNKPEELELVLTGRGASADVIEYADYVSEIKCVKHPYEKGICARYGIEY